MYTAQPLPYYPTLSSPPTTQPSNSVPSQRSSTVSTADTSLLSDFTSDPDGGAGGKSWGHLDLSLGLGASLRRNGWTSNDGDQGGRFRPEEEESPEDPYQPNGNWSTFADDLIVVDEDETEVGEETGRQEVETAHQPSVSSRRLPSSFQDSRFHGSNQTDLLVDITPPFSSSTPPPPSYHPFPSSKLTQPGVEATGSLQKNSGGRPSLQTLLNSIEDRTLQLHQESVSGVNRIHRSSSHASQHSDANDQTPLVNQVRPTGSELTASAPRASSDAVQRLKEAMNRARSIRESSPTLNKQPLSQQMKPAQKRESRSRAVVENWLEETSAEISPPLRSESQEDELTEESFQSPPLPRTIHSPTSLHIQTSKNLPSMTPSGRRIDAHPSFPPRSPRLSDHYSHSLDESPREEDEVAEELSTASSEQDSPPTPPPRLPPHFSRRSPSSFVVAPPFSPPLSSSRINLPPSSPSLTNILDQRRTSQSRPDHSTPARSGMSPSFATPVLNTISVRNAQTPAAPGGWVRTSYQMEANKIDKDDRRGEGEIESEEMKTEQEAQDINRQAETHQNEQKSLSPSISNKTIASSTSRSISHSTSLQSHFKASSLKNIPVVPSKSLRTQPSVASNKKIESVMSASASPVRLQPFLTSSRVQLSPRRYSSTPIRTPSKRVQFEPKTPAAPGGWGWTPYQPKIHKDITQMENSSKDANQAENQISQAITDSDHVADDGLETREGSDSAVFSEAALMQDVTSRDRKSAKVRTVEVISAERVEDEDRIVRESRTEKKDSLATQMIVSNDETSLVSKVRDARDQHDQLEEVLSDTKSVVLEAQFHSTSLSPTESSSYQGCSTSRDHPSPNICPTALNTPSSSKLNQQSYQTPLSQLVPQTPALKTPAAPGAWGWTPFPFKRQPSTLASQSPVVSSSSSQMLLPPSTPPKVSSSVKPPSQMVASPSADQMSSPIPKILAFGPLSTSSVSTVTSAHSTMTTMASPSRLRIAHLRAQLNKAEDDEGAARRRVQNARKDWESVKWVRGKAGDIGPREPRVIRAKAGLWTILGWCAVIAWICFSVARHVYDGYNDPSTTSPFHPALYSPPESSSSLFTASMGLPPGLSAFEVPGQIQTRWNLLLRDWIAAEWLKLK